MLINVGKTILIIFFILLAVLGGGFYFFIYRSKEFQTIVSPFQSVSEQQKSGAKQPEIKKGLFGKRINILLIGTDTSSGRRGRGQSGFNTDSMILVSIDTETNKVLLTTVPRDLWINGNKINALYIVYGEDTLVDAYEKITGLKIDKIIRVDFDQFMWVVDSFGGVPINIPNTFTDTTFPRMDDSGVRTVSFTQGSEVMTSERALTYARSRHGDNGEGSDLMRAKRQHLILQGLLDAVKQPNSQFWPMSMELFYKAATGQGIHTTLTLDDCYYLWDMYKDREKYEVESFVIGSKYIYHPGMYPDSEYHAWVFIPREPGFANLHTDIEAKLNKTFVDENAQPTNAGTTQPATTTN